MEALQAMPPPRTAIPLPAQPFSIHPQSSGEALIRIIDQGSKVTYLKVDAVVTTILALVDGERSAQEIAQTTNQQENTDFSADDILSLCYTGLVHLFNPAAAPEKKQKYLRLRTTVISQKRVIAIARYVAGIFRSPAVIFSFFAVLVATLISFFYFVPSVPYSMAPLWLIPLTMSVSLVLHEFGHAAACQAYGAEPGEIGFGFYLFTPVLYSNVTDAWQLTSSQRVVVDVAGMFMETSLAALAVFAYLMTGSPSYYIMAGAIFFNTIININPLLRYDGYWILSDLLNEPNLRPRSVATLRAAGIHLLRGDWRAIGDYSRTLLIYGLASQAFQLWFLYFISRYHIAEVIALPVTAVTFLGSIVGLTDVPENFSVFGSILLPMFFYVMVWNYIRRLKFTQNVLSRIIQLYRRRR